MRSDLKVGEVATLMLVVAVLAKASKSSWPPATFALGL